MENKFNSQRDLFNKLKPALKTKVHELERSGIRYIREIDIWDFNKENSWRNATGLTIASMVNDILNTDEKLYIEFTLKRLRKRDNDE